MRKIIVLIGTLVLSTTLLASPNWDVNKIFQKIKSSISGPLTKAYCIASNDCHQRVVYVANDSGLEASLLGCHFDNNKLLANGEERISARRNSLGSRCTLSTYLDGKLDTKIELEPKTNTINTLKAGKTHCMTFEKTVKSWKKYPFSKGTYKVKGYIAACIIG